MRTGAVVSGGMHAALIALAVFGNLLFPAGEARDFQVSQVELISAAEFDAAISTAPTTPAEGIAPPPVARETESPRVATATPPEAPPAAARPAPPPPPPEASLAPAGDAPDTAVQMALAPVQPLAPPPPPPPPQQPEAIAPPPSVRAPEAAPPPPPRADARAAVDAATQPEPGAPPALAAEPQETPLRDLAPPAVAAVDGDLPPARATPQPPAAAEIPTAPVAPAAAPAPRPQRIAQAAQAARDAQAPLADATSRPTESERAALDAAIAAATARPSAAPADATPRAQGGAARAARPIAGSVIAGLVSGVKRRFTPVAGTINAASTRVKFEVRLSPEGRLIDRPLLVEPTGTLDPQHAALRRFGLSALIRADEDGVFRALPAESYDLWRTILVTFTPEEILFL